MLQNRIEKVSSSGTVAYRERRVIKDGKEEKQKYIKAQSKGRVKEVRGMFISWNKEGDNHYRVPSISRQNLLKENYFIW